MPALLVRLVCCFFSFSFMYFRATAQQLQETDSLEHALHISKEDTNRVRLLINLVPKYQYADSAKAGAYTRQAVTLSTHLHDDYGLAAAYRLSGVLEADKSHFDAAVQWYKKAQAVIGNHREYSWQVLQALLIQNMAVIHHFNEEYEKAISLYLEASQRFEKLHKENLLFYTYNNIIDVYVKLNKFQSALQYAWANYRLSQKTNDPFQLGMSLITLGMSKMKMKQYDSVATYFKRAAAYGAMVKSPIVQTHAWRLLANYYADVDQNFKAAFEPARKAVDFATQTGNSLYRAQAYDAIGNVYQGLGNYSEAVFYLKKTAAVSDSNSLLEPAKYAYRSLSEIEEKQHHYDKALHYLHRFIDAKDSLTEKDHEKQINELESKYQSQRKEQQIANLQKEQQIQQLQLKKRSVINNALWGGIVALLIISVLIYINFRRRHQLQDLRIRDLEQERQLVAVQSVMKGEEQERSRLARDLHDGVGGLLSGVKLSLKAMEANAFIQEENRKAIDHAVMQLDHSIAELRRVSHNIMPESLIRYGLKETVENYCENLHLSGSVQVQVQSYGLEKRLDQSREIIIYRMIQELLNNVLKHADAKRILLQMVRNGNRLSITVEDDGNGFDTEKSDKKNGAGLVNIKARVEYLGGTVDIHSNPGEGTSVHIEVNCV